MAKQRQETATGCRRKEQARQSGSEQNAGRGVDDEAGVGTGMKMVRTADPTEQS